MASLDRHSIAVGVIQDIVSALSLVAGRSYQVQNVSGYQRPIRFYDGGADAPAAGQGNEIKTLDAFTFDAAASTPMWVWGVNGAAVLAINDDT